MHNYTASPLHPTIAAMNKYKPLHQKQGQLRGYMARFGNNSNEHLLEVCKKKDTPKELQQWLKQELIYRHMGQVITAVSRYLVKYHGMIKDADKETYLQEAFVTVIDMFDMVDVPPDKLGIFVYKRALFSCMRFTRHIDTVKYSKTKDVYFTPESIPVIEHQVYLRNRADCSGEERYNTQMDKVMHAMNPENNILNKHHIKALQDCYLKPTPSKGKDNLAYRTAAIHRIKKWLERESGAATSSSPKNRRPHNNTSSSGGHISLSAIRHRPHSSTE